MKVLLRLLFVLTFPLWCTLFLLVILVNVVKWVITGEECIGDFVEWVDEKYLSWISKASDHGSKKA